MKNRLRERTIIFHLMTSGAKTIDLRPNLIAKRNWDMRRASKCFFFEFFLTIILLEILAIVCEKVVISSKFDLR